MTDQPRPTSENGGDYEFSAAQNESFTQLADIIRFVAILILLFGGLGIAAGALNLSIGNRELLTAGVLIGEGVLGIALGTWLRLAAGSFEDVAHTDGADITHLMSALSRLASVFRLQAWLLGLSLLLLLGVLVRSIIGALTGA